MKHKEMVDEILQKIYKDIHSVHQAFIRYNNKSWRGPLEEDISKIIEKHIKQCYYIK